MRAVFLRWLLRFSLKTATVGWSQEGGKARSRSGPPLVGGPGKVQAAVESAVLELCFCSLIHSPSSTHLSGDEDTTSAGRKVVFRIQGFVLSSKENASMGVAGQPFTQGPLELKINHMGIFKSQNLCTHGDYYLKTLKRKPGMVDVV